MRGAGLGMAFAHLRNRKPTRKCPRCGLRHAVDEPHCPHCHGLSETDLAELKARVAAERRQGQRLGRLLLWAAVAGTVLLVLGAL